MHTKPHTATGQTAHPWLTAEWVYDAIMRHIDEDLTTESLRTLRERHANDTPLQRTERAVRYGQSFAAFDRALDIFRDELAENVQLVRREQQQSLSAAEASVSGQELSAVETQLGNFAAA